MKPKKAQVAFEYIVIVMLVLAFIVPVWVYVSGMEKDAMEQLSLSYAKNAVENIASTADLVYSQGPPAKLSLRIYIPDGVQAINITSRVINMQLQRGSMHTDVFAMSSATLNGTLSTEEGAYFITLEAVGDYVQING